jgi:hypothetical protein
LLRANDRFSHRKTSNQKDLWSNYLIQRSQRRILAGAPQRYPGSQHLNAKRMIPRAASAFLYHDIVTCFGRSGVLERQNDSDRPSGANDQFTSKAQGAGS